MTRFKVTHHTAKAGGFFAVPWCGLLSPEATLSEVGERELLLHLKRRIPEGPGVVLGIGHDAAVVETSPLTLVTTDSLVEGVHFRRDWHPPRLLGRKALSVNLSDMAAMAGVPRYAVVSLCLPLPHHDGVRGRPLRRPSGARRPRPGSTSWGATSRPRRARRSSPSPCSARRPACWAAGGARPGDLVVVTGTLGAAAAGPEAAGPGGAPRRRGRARGHRGMDRVVGGGAAALPARPARSPAALVLRPRAGRGGAAPRGHRPLRRLVRRPPPAVRSERGGGDGRRLRRARRPAGRGPGARAGRRRARPRPSRRRGLSAPDRPPRPRASPPSRTSP